MRASTVISGEPSLGVMTTRRGPSSRPVPRSTVAPESWSRFTAAASSQWSVASSAIRFATGAHDGVTVTSPASCPARCASASASAARSIIFEGMHP